MENLTTEFFKHVERMIDTVGVYPHPGLALMPDGGLQLAALALNPPGVFRWFWDMVSTKGAVECITGLDRNTKEGQGTEFRDVMTCWYWKEGLDDKPWNESFRVAVINYQDEPRIVRPFDWDNEYWNDQAAGELAAFTPRFRVTIKEGQPDVG